MSTRRLLYTTHEYYTSLEKKLLSNPLYLSRTLSYVQTEKKKQKQKRKLEFTLLDWANRKLDEYEDDLDDDNNTTSLVMTSSGGGSGGGGGGNNDTPFEIFQFETTEEKPKSGVIIQNNKKRKRRELSSSSSSSDNQSTSKKDDYIDVVLYFDTFVRHDTSTLSSSNYTIIPGYLFVAIYSITPTYTHKQITGLRYKCEGNRSYQYKKDQMLTSGVMEFELGERDYKSLNNKVIIFYFCDSSHLPKPPKFLDHCLCSSNHSIHDVLLSGRGDDGGGEGIGSANWYYSQWRLFDNENDNVIPEALYDCVLHPLHPPTHIPTHVDPPSSKVKVVRPRVEFRLKWRVKSIPQSGGGGNGNNGGSNNNSMNGGWGGEGGSRLTRHNPSFDRIIEYEKRKKKRRAKSSSSIRNRKSMFTSISPLLFHSSSSSSPPSLHYHIINLLCGSFTPPFSFSSLSSAQIINDDDDDDDDENMIIDVDSSTPISTSPSSSSEMNKKGGENGNGSGSGGGGGGDNKIRVKRFSMHMTSFKCILCGRKCDHMLSLIFHMITHHDIFAYHLHIENQSNKIEVEMIKQSQIDTTNANVDFIYRYNNNDRMELQLLSKVAPLVVHCSNQYSSSPLPPLKSFDISSLPKDITFYFSNGAIKEGESLAYDSEDEIDMSWLRQKMEKMIDECHDISPSQKLFMKLWNQFILPHKIHSDKQLPLLCLQFAHTHRNFFTTQSRKVAFIVHLINLWDYGLIEPYILSTCLQSIKLLEPL